MLLVPTYVSTSSIAGKGLFAARDIAAGEIVWRFVDGFDKRLSQTDVELLTQSERNAVVTWGYLSQRNGQWVICGDEARRVNHSDQPNLAGGYDSGRPGDEGYSYAVRPIAAGEELTDDYRSYDQSTDRKLSGELSPLGVGDALRVHGSGDTAIAALAAASLKDRSTETAFPSQSA